MKKCIKCGSHAFNLYAEGIDQGGLCDVHYWQGRAHRAEAQPEQAPVAINQHRIPYCADWYDGIPDHHDGHGPYEVRTLYTTPPKRPWVSLTATAKLDLLSTAKGAGGRINGDAQLLELLNEHETQIKRKNT